MFFSRKPATLPSAKEALPGRDEAIPTASEHFVNGRALKGPYPEGSEVATFGLGCFWGAERAFWKLPGVCVTAVGYAGGTTPNPTYREVCSGMTGHNEVVRVVFDPDEISYELLVRAFFESHDPTQGMRQGNDVGTQYRSGIYVENEAQRETAERVRAAYAAELKARGYPADHDRDRRCRAVLLRRGLPPAVPGEEPRRLLRPRRHRRRLPGRNGRRRRVSRHRPTRHRVPGRVTPRRGAAPPERLGRSQKSPPRTGFGGGAGGFFSAGSPAASSTMRHSCGRSARVIGGLGFEGLSEGA